MKLCAAAMATGALLAVGRAGASEPPGRVVLSLPSCEPWQLSAEQVRGAVSLELAESGLVLAPADAPPSSGAIQASVATTCVGDALLELHASSGARSGERMLRLDEVPAPARARALALALAELLVALRPEEQPAPEPVELEDDPVTETAGATPPRSSTPPEKAPPTPPAARSREAARGLAPGTSDAGADERSRSTPPRRKRSVLEAAGELRSFGLTSSTRGVRVGGEINRFALGVGVLQGDATGSLGSVSALIAQGYLTWWMTELGREEAPWLGLGSRLGIGFLSLTAAPAANAAGENSSNPYLDLAEACRVSATLAPFRVATQVELGYALGAMAYAGQDRLARYGGWFGTAVLELGLML